jgi:hypothetical protein
VVVLGGVLGALAGLVVGVLFTELIFANNQSWPDVVPFALAVAGALAGAEGARRLRTRRRAKVS